MKVAILSETEANRLPIREIITHDFLSYQKNQDTFWILIDQTNKYIGDANLEELKKLTHHCKQ